MYTHGPCPTHYMYIHTAPAPLTTCTLYIHTAPAPLTTCTLYNYTHSPCPTHYMYIHTQLLPHSLHVYTHTAPAPLTTCIYTQPLPHSLHVHVQVPQNMPHCNHNFTCEHVLNYNSLKTEGKEYVQLCRHKVEITDLASSYIMGDTPGGGGPTGGWAGGRIFSPLVERTLISCCSVAIS